jgi:hypothetical protein
MRSTGSRGELQIIPDCWIQIPGLSDARARQGADIKDIEYTDQYGIRTPIVVGDPDDDKIYARILPDISDSKSAQYNDEAIIGRSSPFKTYSHSENRTISWTSYFIVTEYRDIRRNLVDLRAIQSVTYPRDYFQPYAPPPVCSIKCGRILGDTALCVVLRSYTVKYPTDVSWDEETYLPYKFSVDMSWDVVYQSDNLPGYERILGID